MAKKRRSYRARDTTNLWASRAAAGMAIRHEPNLAMDVIRSQAIPLDECFNAVESRTHRQQYARQSLGPPSPFPRLGSVEQGLWRNSLLNVKGEPQVND